MRGAKLGISDCHAHSILPPSPPPQHSLRASPSKKVSRSSQHSLPLNPLRHLRRHPWIHFHGHHLPTLLQYPHGQVACTWTNFEDDIGGFEIGLGVWRSWLARWKIRRRDKNELTLSTMLRKPTQHVGQYPESHERTIPPGQKHGHSHSPLSNQRIHQDVLSELRRVEQMISSTPTPTSALAGGAGGGCAILGRALRRCRGTYGAG